MANKLFIADFPQGGDTSFVSSHFIVITVRENPASSSINHRDKKGDLISKIAL